MNIKKVLCEAITVYNKETNEAIARITDNEIRTHENYQVFLECYSEVPEDNWIAKTGNVIVMKDNPEHIFAVVHADNRFFRCIRMILDDHDHVILDNKYALTYPNNKMIGSLEDFGFELLQEEGVVAADASTEESKKKNN